MMKEDVKLEEFLKLDEIPSPSPFLEQRIIAESKARRRVGLKDWLGQIWHPKPILVLAICLILGFAAGLYPGFSQDTTRQNGELYYLLHDVGAEL
jgi:hypothetical protein